MKSTPPATITVQVPLRLTKRGGRKLVCFDAVPQPAPVSPNEPIVTALAKAHRWRNRIEGGEFASVTELAKAEKINQSYACRILRLSLLSPRIVEQALDGRLPAELSLKDLLVVLPAVWSQQPVALGLGNEA